VKIRIVHQYFHPDLSSVSQVISQVAFDLAAHGSQVDIVCSRNKYDRAQSGEILPAREVAGGVDIWRCWGPSFGRRSLPGYFIDMVSFCALAAARSMIMPKADTVVLLTNPPLFSLLGVAVKRIRKERFVYVLMDVYPDVAIQAGMLRKGSVAERVSRRISRIALREADSVVVPGDDMREVAIREGASPEKVVVIRNWANPVVIYPVPPEENLLRREWGLEGKFVVEYSGNLGVSHFFEDILAVARELLPDDGIRFVFIGGGTRYKEVERFVREENLSNILLMPYREKSVLAQSLSVGDVHYVSLRPGFEGLVVPSKAYGIMAAGRPMIYQGSPAGEIARMVIDEGIGHVVPAGDRTGLREAILGLYHDKEARDRMGTAARSVLEERYSLSKSLGLYRKLLTGTS
jgi:glycosyltransferase involved in cell wall biosynthesis